MNICFYIFISLFATISLLQLFFNYRKIELGRVITKPLCLLTLSLSFIFFNVNLYLVYVSCFVAMAGDILLLFKKRKILFVLGGTLFTIEHILNFILISRVFSSFPTYLYIIILPSIFLFGLFSLLKKNRKKLFFCAYSYFGFQFANILLALIGLIIYKNMSLLMVIGGYLFFAFSDFLILYKLIYGDFKNRSFYLILTYLIAQPTILFGVSLL